MKIKTTLAAAVVMVSILAVSCSRSKDNSFVIEGNISGVSDSVLVILFKTMDPISGAGKGVMRDTLIDGKFSFNFNIEDSLDKYNVMLISASERLPPQQATVYAEPGRKALITGEGCSPLKWKVSSRVKKQKDLQTLLKYTADVYSEVGLAQIDRSLPAERYSARMDSLQRKSFEKTLEYLESEKVTEIWIENFHSWAKYAGIYNIEEMKAKIKALLPRLSEAQMSDPVIQDALPYLDISVPLKVGDVFPQLKLYDADGLPHKVSDFSGKKVMIEFTTFGCAACYLSKPRIVELCRAHPDDLVVLIVNQNGYEAWRKEARTSEVPNMLELNDDNGGSGIFRRLGTGGYPSFVSVSPDGIVTGIQLGYNEDLLFD